MQHGTTLIATIALAFAVALLFGVLAARLRLPPIVGYLLAGIAIGVASPSLAAEGGVAAQASEMGVVLLMFGVGLHFSLRDLMAVRAIVVPGALLQIAITGTAGTMLGRWWGLSVGGAIVLGLSVAVASTVVVLKGLEARDRLDSPEGRVAVGWLVVEDLSMVLVLVLLPAVAVPLGGTPVDGQALTAGGLARSIALAIGNVIAFLLLMFVAGRRVVPWLLAHVARLGSRELFTLTVLAIALGVGTIASQLFGMSFALGAFVAGAVVSESELSHRAAADALPLQDAFAVLFFVSVGLLFDPHVLVDHLGKVLAVLGVVMLMKFVASFAVLRLLGESGRLAVTIAGSLAQIGEFSFILMALGASLGLLDRDTHALVVGAALLSITVNQPLQGWLQRMLARYAPGIPESFTEADAFDFSAITDHVILVGYGRVGTTVTEALDRAGVSHIVVEEQPRVVAGIRLRGEHAISGDATRADVLRRAGVTGARLIVVTAPEPIRARRIVEVARELNPRIAVAVRTHSASEQAFFEQVLPSPGVHGRAVYAEREVALSLAHYTLTVVGRSDDEADALIDAMRGRRTMPTETFSAMRTREFRAAMGISPGQSETGGGPDG
ncbi:MAG: sodium:proton antiporter [Gemmatimonadetes bacterium]|nr:MAG: sodium:proton antiporter [Gemmatimonadota bacterium]